jgi:hypothetical protein
MLKKTTILAAAALGLVAGSAQAQLGWTDTKCYSEWGYPISTHMNLEAGTLECIFSTGSDLRMQIDFMSDKTDDFNRVQSIIYSSASKHWLVANTHRLLQENYAGNWQLYNDGRGKATIHTWKVLDQNGNNAACAIFQRSDNGDGRYTLQVATAYFDSYINSHGGEPQSKIDADWARVNSARIEAEKKAKAAAGPTKEELESAAHDAEIRANNERALKELNHE